MTTRRRATLGGMALALLIVACGGDGEGEQSTGTRGDAGTITAQVASYDLSVGRDQRVTVGLVVEGEGGLVGFGAVELAFAFVGTKDQPVTTPRPGATTTAEFLPVPGQKPAGDISGPRIVQPSEMIGVYAARGVRFDQAGSSQVAARAQLAGKPVVATGTFEVIGAPRVVSPGEAAPRSENLLPGAVGAPPKAVDSRAGDDGTVPDPELHTQTVAAAVASGRPTMVVISTPVYCESRFCGPITDSVRALATEYGTRMNFVHIEVWRNFQATEMNKAAAEWIYRTPGQDINEPWVFVVAGDGTIVDRFDNVAGDGELAGAVERSLR